MTSNEIDIKTRYVSWIAALDWIAYQDLRGESFDPIPFFLINDEYISRKTHRSEGRLDLAYDFLWNKVLKGKIRVIGKKVTGWNKVLKGQGEETHENKYNVIPKNFFEDADLEWDEGGTIYDDNMEYKDIWVCFDDLEREFPALGEQERDKVGNASASTEVVPLDTSVAKRGRPPKYNWDEFFVEIIRLANGIDGVPETQSELEATMAEWCLNQWGTEPAESTIRDKISPIYKAIREGRKF